MLRLYLSIVFNSTSADAAIIAALSRFLLATISFASELLLSLITLNAIISSLLFGLRITRAISIIPFMLSGLDSDIRNFSLSLFLLSLSVVSLTNILFAERSD